jgi:glycosyltransferase involved in cell wall biosynthesis
MLPHRNTLLVMDWHEVWPRSTWIDEFGPVGNLGWLAEVVARPLGKRVAFSNLHANRLPGGAIKVPEFISIEHPSEAQNALEPDRSLLLCVGRLVPNKRFDLLPGTLAALRKSHPERDWHALVIGSGPQLERIKSEARFHGVAERIEFDSGLSAEDLSNHLSTSGVLFHPSRREGFGIILLEASAHGLPSIVCRAVDNAGVELIEPGENGEISATVSFNDLAAAVWRALADDGGRDRTLGWWMENRHGFTSTAAAEALEAIWNTV